MGGLLERLQRSAAGRFYAKFSADLAVNGAILIDWQALFSLFPLILGYLGIFGLVLRDPTQRQSLAEDFASLFPAQFADLLGFMEETRALGGLLGLLSMVGLVWSGYWLFQTMELVFNHFYDAPDRDFRGQLVMALTMMGLYVVLVPLSVLAGGVSTFLVGFSERVLPFEIPGFAFVIGWLVSLGSAVLMFLALYRVVPNHPLTLADVWRGAALAGLLFVLLNQVFPLYFHLFGGAYTAYKTLGLFLVLMTWFYCLALIIVLGAELNAFLCGYGPCAEDDSPAAGTSRAPNRFCMPGGRRASSESRPVELVGSNPAPARPEESR